MSSTHSSSAVPFEQGAVLGIAQGFRIEVLLAGSDFEAYASQVVSAVQQATGNGASLQEGAVLRTTTSTSERPSASIKSEIRVA